MDDDLCFPVEKKRSFDDSADSRGKHPFHLVGNNCVNYVNNILSVSKQVSI